MKLKKDKKVVLVVSFVWLVFAIVSFLLVLHSLKFPVINEDNIFSIVLIFALPIMSILFSVVPDRYIKPILYILLCICFVVFFVYVMFVSLGFTDYRTPFYPVSISATDNISDYLVLDDLGEFNEDKLVYKVFPEKIPSNAVDASYSYECEPYKFSWRIEASWILVGEEYNNEKNRISMMTGKKIEKDGNIYYDMSTEESYCHICFNDEEHSITYVDILGYYYDYRKISGIGDW